MLQNNKILLVYSKKKKSTVVILGIFKVFVCLPLAIR